MHGSVDRYTCRTPHFHMYSHCTDHITQMTCVHWLKTSCAPKNIPSSMRHVSPFAARDTEHFLTFSFFYLSCVTVVLSSEPRPVVHVSSYPLRRSTAGWYFHGNPLLHTCTHCRLKRAQRAGHRYHTHINRTWKSTRTRTSRKFRVYSISHRNWYWSILKGFWMWIRFTAPLHPGRDQYCLMSDPVDRGKNTCLLRFRTVSGKMNDSKQLNDGKVKWKNSKSFPFLPRNAGNQWRTNWIRVEYFSGFTSLQILQEIQINLQKRNIVPEEFTDQIISMPTSNDIDWTRKGSDEIFRVQNRARTLDVPRSWRWKEMVWNSQLYSWRKIPISLLRKWWSDSRNRVIQYSRASVLWVVEFWKGRTKDSKSAQYLRSRRRQKMIKHWKKWDRKK